MRNTNKHPMESLQLLLAKRFPEAQITLDAPEHERGIWFLDVSVDGQAVSIQWKQDAGFGITASTSSGYGEGADEVYEDPEAAYGRIVSLLLSHSETSPPPGVRLGELRKERGISQVQLAELLTKRQAAISKIEGRGDVKVSSLRHFVEAMGATLQLVARFPNGEERLLNLNPEPIGGKPSSRSTSPPIPKDSL